MLQHNKLRIAVIVSHLLVGLYVKYVAMRVTQICDLFEGTSRPIMDALDVAKIPFFYDLSEPDLKKLAAVLLCKSFSSDQTIFKEGDEQSGMYFILDGEVQIVKKNIKGND